MLGYFRGKLNKHVPGKHTKFVPFLFWQLDCWVLGTYIKLMETATCFTGSPNKGAIVLKEVSNLLAMDFQG